MKFHRLKNNSIAVVQSAQTVLSRSYCDEKNLKKLFIELKTGKSDESDDRRESDAADKKEGSFEFDPLIKSVERSAPAGATTTAAAATAAPAATAATAATTAVIIQESGDEYADSLLEIARSGFRSVFCGFIAEE